MADSKHRDTSGAAGDGANGPARGMDEGDAAADAPAVDAGAAPPGEGSEASAPPSDAGGELESLRERLLRLAAEFDNYRKRVERERGDSWVRAQAQLLERLLEPLDDLQRIADFDPETTPSGALHEGAEMVERKFLRAMETAGLEVIDDAAGKPFDPTVHEGLTTVPAQSEAEDDTVDQVYQKGYRFKGVLLRPARVVVRKYHG